MRWKNVSVLHAVQLRRGGSGRKDSSPDAAEPGEQVDRPECDVSQESLRRAFHGRHVRQPPGELQHLLGCRPPQRFIRVEVAFVPAPRNHLG